MAAMPTWIVVLQALLTPTIAAVVGLIAFMQWRTTHQKVVLDLFEKRMEIVQTFEDLVRMIYREGIKADPIRISLFHSARSKARYLFGADVNLFFEKFHGYALEMSISASMMEHSEGEERKRYVAEAYEQLKKTIHYEATFTSVISPYLLMDQKRVRTPAEWVRDKNLQRLSYADEKQR